VFDRISTFSDETAGDYSRLARLDERNLRVGPKAEEVFLPGTWAAIAEKPRFASVRPHAQGQPIPIREQIGTLARFGDTKYHFGLGFDAFGHGLAPRFRVYASVYARIVDAPVRDSRRRKQKTP
jgi:hypothetical protein